MTAIGVYPAIGAMRLSSICRWVLRPTLLERDRVKKRGVPFHELPAYMAMIIDVQRSGPNAFRPKRHAGDSSGIRASARSPIARMSPGKMKRWKGLKAYQ